MIKNRSYGEKQPATSERSIGVALAEFGRWLVLSSLPFIIYAYATTNSILPTDPADWADWWFVALGETFLTDAGWLLPTVLAIVLAFYGALIGQSVVDAEAAEIHRTRRRLVPAGLALASVVVWFDVAAMAAAAVRPEGWFQLPGILLISICIVLLGMGIGRFRTRSHRQELDLAKRQHAASQSFLTEISVFDRKRPSSAGGGSSFEAYLLAHPLLVVVGNVALAWVVLVIPVVAVTVVSGVRDGRLETEAGWTLLWFSLHYLVIGFLGVTISTFLRSFSFDLHGLPRLVVDVSAAGIVGLLFVFQTGVFIGTGGADWLPLAFGTVRVVASLVIVLSLFARNRTRYVFVLTLNSAARERRRKFEQREVLRLSKRIGELERSVRPRQRRPLRRKFR